MAICNVKMPKYRKMIHKLETGGKRNALFMVNFAMHKEIGQIPK